MYPKTRMRRLRRTEGMRRLAAETGVSRDDLIYPLFAVPGEGRRESIPSMPGVERMSVDLLRERAAGLKSGAILLFGVPDADAKDDTGSSAVRDDALVPAAVRALKDTRPDVTVITDLCLCAYTDHGHCGVLAESGEVDNDATLPLLAGMARAHAAAGADMVAPSGMMDGMVGAIREGLDGAGFQGTAIMSYAAKFASAFYGPFRDAAHSSPSFGDRRSYQFPPGNAREALKDALLDEAEGADWLMVKPAMPYLDVLRDLRRETRLPISAYQVSGEYAMLKFAARADAIDEQAAALESVLCIRRAGADAVITYYAEDVCGWLEAGC
ncbi:MAG: porphobilinogen synthase [Candidatus Brocadiia bacterium]|nr:porphobilinogen synthase [Candidatus Brocadiia bacterium]